MIVLDLHNIYVSYHWYSCRIIYGSHSVSFYMDQIYRKITKLCLHLFSCKNISAIVFCGLQNMNRVLTLKKQLEACSWVYWVFCVVSLSSWGLTCGTFWRWAATQSRVARRILALRRGDHRCQLPKSESQLLVVVGLPFLLGDFGDLNFKRHSKIHLNHC